MVQSLLHGARNEMLVLNQSAFEDEKEGRFQRDFCPFYGLPTGRNKEVVSHRVWQNALF